MVAHDESMQVVELSPLQACTLLWHPAVGSHVLTVICKATYDLQPGIAPLSEAQDDVNERDLHSENNSALGLHSASDLAPYKRYADVSVVGKAYSPPGELARSVIARVRVGTVDKRVSVHAQRYRTASGEIKDEAFFSKMPIGYERAAGGPDTDNPVGVCPGGKEDAEGRRVLPNLQNPDDALAGPDQALLVAGFGPIAAAWPGRQRWLGGRAAPWQGHDWSAELLPADFDWRYFNVAPPDQQLHEIHADEQLWLDHLHPEEPQLHTRLPGVRPIVFVEGAAGAQVVAVRGDTLWIDTNRLVLTLTWRGQLTLMDDQRPRRVLVASARAGEELSWEQVWALAERSVPPPSSGDQDRETLVRQARRRNNGGPQSIRGVTSPVPLVPTTDHAPDWLPPPSAAGVVQPRSSSGGAVLEVSLDGAEAGMLERLCHEAGCGPAELVARLIREADASSG